MRASWCLFVMAFWGPAAIGAQSNPADWQSELPIGTPVRLTLSTERASLSGKIVAVSRDSVTVGVPRVKSLFGADVLEQHVLAVSAIQLLERKTWGMRPEALAIGPLLGGALGAVIGWISYSPSESLRSSQTTCNFMCPDPPILGHLDLGPSSRSESARWGAAVGGAVGAVSGVVVCLSGKTRWVTVLPVGRSSLTLRPARDGGLALRLSF